MKFSGSAPIRNSPAAGRQIRLTDLFSPTRKRSFPRSSFLIPSRKRILQASLLDLTIKQRQRTKSLFIDKEDLSSSSSPPEKSEGEEDPDLADFIVDDITSTRNVPDFSQVLSDPNRGMRTKIGTRGAFHIFLQYIVSTCIDDDFEDLIAATPNESYFIPAIRKIETYIQSCSVLLCSNVWNKQYLDLIKKYPIFRSWENKNSLNERSCAACQRGKDSASYCATLSGFEYDSVSFWKGAYRLPAQEKFTEKTIYLGSMCHARSKLYHRLYHYKYTLLQKIKKKVDSLEPEEISADPKDTLEYVLQFFGAETLTKGFFSFMDQIFKFLSKETDNRI